MDPLNTPSAPTTPTRPPRSLARSSIHSHRTIPLSGDYIEEIPETPSSFASTPTIPPRSSPSPSAISRSSAANPPRYLPSVDPPRASELPTYESYSLNTNPRHSDVECGTGLPSPGSSRGTSEELPVYAEKVQTEPDTLARKLWMWGFLCPALWIIGALILAIPLKPTEPESDADRAQKLEEMIVILRQVRQMFDVEIKYGRRCLWSLLGLILFIAAIVIIATVVTHGK